MGGREGEGGREGGRGREREREREGGRERACRAALRALPLRAVAAIMAERAALKYTLNGGTARIASHMERSGEGSTLSLSLPRRISHSAWYIHV